MVCHDFPTSVERSPVPLMKLPFGVRTMGTRPCARPSPKGWLAPVVGSNTCVLSLNDSSHWFDVSSTMGCRMLLTIFSSRGKGFGSDQVSPSSLDSE